MLHIDKNDRIIQHHVIKIHMLTMGLAKTGALIGLRCGHIFIQITSEYSIVIKNQFYK
jgi:hypothetical protein